MKSTTACRMTVRCKYNRMSVGNDKMLVNL